MHDNAYQSVDLSEDTLFGLFRVLLTTSDLGKEK